MKLPPRPPQQCTLLVWRVGTTGHLFSTFTGKVDWVSTLIEISFNFHLMRLRQMFLIAAGKPCAISGGWHTGHGPRRDEQVQDLHRQLLIIKCNNSKCSLTHHYSLSTLNSTVLKIEINISRSLHGGLSRDGREDEAYPLQPYYFLALIPWQYDHLDEEYA